MSDVLNQLKTGSFKLKKPIITDIKKISNKGGYMSEMEMVLRRRISLLDGN